MKLLIRDAKAPDDQSITLWLEYSKNRIHLCGKDAGGLEQVLLVLGKNGVYRVLHQNRWPWGGRIEDVVREELA